MEAVAGLRCSFGNASLLPCDRAARSLSDRVNRFRAAFKPMTAGSWVQQRWSVPRTKIGNTTRRKHSAIRASMQPSKSDSSDAPVAPLQLESPIGQFLCQILKSHPHLVISAAEQQLEQLQSDRESEKDKEEPFTSGTELVLYRRIAELKSNERKKTLEEILYALVVQKFMDADVPLMPSITPLSPVNANQVNTWLRQVEKLQSLYTPEAYEMVQNHLVLVLGNRLGEYNSIAELSKLRIGQVYAASIMYGYFLRRIDQRFQLEKTMKLLPEGTDSEITKTGGENSDDSFGNGRPHPEVSSWEHGGGGFVGIKPSKLRTYVMSFDGEALQRYAAIRSKEAISIIERHTEALFGRPEVAISPQGTIDSSKDEVIKISFGGLKRLVLEAVAFGSFLWDIESYVDARYHFVAN